MDIDHGKRTADGVPVTDGLIVWDHNLDIAIVSYARTFRDGVISEWWDGWFEMTSKDGGLSSVMDGQRMNVRHPYTGERASMTSVGYTESKERK